jgi:hypothetical protein
MASERKTSLADAYASMASSSLPRNRVPIDFFPSTAIGRPIRFFVQQMSFFHDVYLTK